MQSSTKERVSSVKSPRWFYGMHPRPTRSHEDTRIEDARQKPVHRSKPVVSGGISTFAPAQGPTPVASGATATQSPSRAQH